MFNQEFTRLDRAAKMLGVDPDDLLLAAVEKKITVFGLLQDFYLRHVGSAECPDGENVKWTDSLNHRRLLIVPLFSHGAADILKYGKTDLDGVNIGEQIEEEIDWNCNPDESGQGIDEIDSYVAVAKDFVFVRSELIASAISTPTIIGGDTFARLQRAIAAFPDQYPDYQSQPPKLKDVVRPWLKKVGLACNDREAHVFGTIIAEHFKLLGDTHET